LHEQKIQQVTT